MKTIVAFGMAIAIGISGFGAAQAAPMGGAIAAPAWTGTQAELVSGGCGPRGHRDRFGNCRPNYRPEYRRCPPGTHPTPGGCRRNY